MAVSAWSLLGWLCTATACLACLAADSPRAPPEAVVSSGRLSGKWVQSRQGRGIAAFEGIPFAAPPVGELRFQAPQSAKPWGSVLRATKPGPICTQRAGTDIVGEEDCLYLNVYVPEDISFEKPIVDVLVYIHGGAWTMGSGSLYESEYLLDHDVVLVTFNYRLGPFGFLSTQDDVFPGNSALKDQVLTLRWVRDNIAAFGGNPESVTIFGESAGGMSVHLHTLSPLSKGLFHKAIAQSGNALVEHTVALPGEARRQAARLAEFVKCPASPSKAFQECLLTKSNAEILAVDVSFREWGTHPPIPFKAVVEPSGPEAFIDRTPGEILLSGDFNDVPLMTGVTSHEGCLFAVEMHENETALRELDERFTYILPIVLLRSHLPKALLGEAFQEVRKFYYGEGPITQDSKENTINMMSDTVFFWSTVQTVKLHAKHGKSPVYFYEFAHPSNRSFALLFGSKSSNYGVCHADDLPFLFPLRNLLPGPELSGKDDMAVSQKHVEFFVNFAKTGSPTEDGSWQSVAHPDGAEYLRISSTTEMRANFNPERMKFWTRLYPRIKRVPSGHDEL